MTRYIVIRLLSFVPTLLAVTLLIFFMLEVAPGDPTSWMLGQEGASSEAIAAIRHQLGLDRPLAERLVGWYVRILRGDLGRSIFLNQPVTEVLTKRYPVTISMAALALLLGIVVGVPAGVLAAVKRGRFADWFTMLLTLIVLSLPIFWLAINLIWLFAVRVRWFPIAGYVPFSQNPLQWLRHLVLPCFSLGMGSAGWIARMTRSSMLEVMGMDYVRTARAKGLRERAVLFRHIFRNAFIPIFTAISMSAAGLLGGSPITESIFQLPGLGRLIVEGLGRRDYPVIQGGILVIMFFESVLILTVDLLYVWIDPRIRYHD